MSTVKPYDANYRNQLELELNKETDQAKTVGVISDALSGAETKLINLYAKWGAATSDADKDTIQHDIDSAQLQYKKISRAFETLQQILKNADETMRRVINNMSFR